MSFFSENVNYNRELSKCRGKPRGRGMVKLVNVKDVVKKLSEKGIVTTDRTIQRYVKAGLVTMPDRSSAGRGKGKRADYPDIVPYEFYASWHLMHAMKISTAEASRVRKLVLEVEEPLEGEDGTRLNREELRLIEEDEYMRNMAVMWWHIRSDRKSADPWQNLVAITCNPLQLLWR